MKSWEVQVDGVKHTIQFKGGFNNKIIVDGETYIAKSANKFIRMLDYQIMFGNTICQVVVVGGKEELAVNGVYLNSEKPYVPLNTVPVVSYVFTGISIVMGLFLCGILGIVIGLLMSRLYIEQGLRKKIGIVVAAFVGCTVLQLILMLIVTAAKVATGLY